jgi:hypothetical protein
MLNVLSIENLNATLKEVTMKSKIMTGPPAFAPITIELVLESKEDLADLWHRLNIGSYAVNEASNEVSPAWRAGGESDDLWRQLDDIARERGFIE